MSNGYDVRYTGPQPQQAHPSDAGADLRAAEAVTLAPGQRALVGTGTRIELPPHTVGMIAPRSGLAAKHGITIVNSPGIIDAGYRGELKVCLLNTDPDATFHIEPGDRIAQLLVLSCPPVRYHAVDALADGERNEAGFGSTGYRDHRSDTDR